MVEQLRIGSERLKEAMLKVEREKFMKAGYKSMAYDPFTPYPIPGRNATISAPNTYPLFYEALDLKEGDKFLELGTGSGYGAALAKEIVGEEGKVYTIEIDEETYRFAEGNLKNAGYENRIKIIKDDGSKGYPPEAPYDKISVTAAVLEIPEPLIKQLKKGGKLVAPEESFYFQDLVLLKKEDEIKKKRITTVRYVPLQKEF